MKREQPDKYFASAHPRRILAVIAGLVVLGGADGSAWAGNMPLTSLGASPAAGMQPVTGYAVTVAEAETLLSQELLARGLGEDMQVTIAARRSQELVRRNVPLVMEVQNLEVDRANQRFTATLGFMTEATLERPSQPLGNLAVSGRYEEMVEVPVVKYRLSAGNIVRDEDVEWQKLPANRLRRDIVRDDSELVGKAIVRGLTPGRPVLQSEVQTPPIVLRRMPVRMSYQTGVLSIQAVGTALQDGAIGDRIKVRNDDSGIELDARVVDRGHVEVLPALAFN